MEKKMERVMERKIVEKELGAIIEMTLRMEDELNNLMKPENN